MRGALRATLLVLALAGAAPALAQDTVSVRTIERFGGAGFGERTGGLVWRGGLELDGPDAFGGISGITFVAPGRMVMVTDRGHFISGELRYNGRGAPSGFSDLAMTLIRNSSGDPLPTAFSRDAEAVETVYRDGVAAAVRVGFENLTRVADFALVDHRPEGAARVVDIPEELSRIRSNETLESVCIAPPASPVAGSTLLIAEDVRNAEGHHSAWMLGVRDRGPLALTRAPGVYPTGCAFLPDGDLLVLERGLGFLTFTMQLRRVPADEVRPGAVMDGEVLLTASGRDIDNMEGIAVHEGPGGETRITLMSDDNFSAWQRTLLLEFALPE